VAPVRCSASGPSTSRGAFPCSGSWPVCQRASTNSFSAPERACGGLTTRPRRSTEGACPRRPGQGAEGGGTPRTRMEAIRRPCGRAGWTVAGPTRRPAKHPAGRDSGEAPTEPSTSPTPWINRFSAGHLGGCVPAGIGGAIVVGGAAGAAGGVVGVFTGLAYRGVEDIANLF